MRSNKFPFYYYNFYALITKKVPSIIYVSKTWINVIIWKDHSRYQRNGNSKNTSPNARWNVNGTCGDILPPWTSHQPNCHRDESFRPVRIVAKETIDAATFTTLIRINTYKNSIPVLFHVENPRCKCTFLESLSERTARKMVSREERVDGKGEVSV